MATGVRGLSGRADEPRTLIWVDPMQANGQPVAAQSSTASPAAVASSAAQGAGEPSSAASTTEAAAARPTLAVERDAAPGPTPEGAPGPPAEEGP